MIRFVQPQDAPSLCGIYNPYVKNSIVTFEESEVTVQEMTRRISEASLPWFVLEDENAVQGYAYLAAWKQRSAYRYTAETTIYLREGTTGRGLGETLYTHLIQAARASSLRVLVACLALPNEPSRRLHEKLGFRKVAHFSRVGLKFERWLDVGYWELQL
ncbi:MAG: N-acetyltransferase [Spirochaetales bacterium]|nr:N-acetyltransferase [Spirochaetales bacterium]